METALYFPYIRVPQSAWFTQILLYWDQVATIVPKSLWGEDAEISPYMYELRRAGLLEFVDPNRDLWTDGRFIDSFLKALDASAILSSTEWTEGRVHAGKMSSDVFRELEQRGLVRGEPWAPWWKVERQTANLYMGYLAGVVTGRRVSEGLNTFPVTDTGEGISELSGLNGTIEDKLRELRYTAVMEALPVPAAALSAEEILDFKNETRDKLARLRRYLDQKLVDIAALDSGELREVKSRLALDEIHDEVETLRERMQKRNWPPILAGIGGVAASILAAGASLATGVGGLALGLSVGAGLLSTADAGFKVFERSRSSPYKDAPLVCALLTPG